MLKRIMLPTDGSPESDRAIPYARIIAREQGAEILLIQVVQLPMMINDEYEGGEAWQQTLGAFEEIAQSNLDNLSSTLRADGIEVRAEKVLGYPAGALLDFEAEHQPDLVVMGTHGRTGIARFALGSVADRMVRHGTTPVLLVREGPAEPRLDHAFVMLDGSGLAEEALKAVKLLAGHPLHTLTLFQAVSDTTDRRPAATYLEGVAARLAKHDLSTRVMTDIGDPGLLFEKAANDADVIVLATHGRGGVDRYRHGSVAERVVHESTKPVLLTRAGILPDPV
jgi:nucleotide-binding universal stress UspA family protein